MQQQQQQPSSNPATTRGGGVTFAGIASTSSRQPPGSNVQRSTPLLSRQPPQQAPSAGNAQSASSLPPKYAARISQPPSTAAAPLSTLSVSAASSSSSSSFSSAFAASSNPPPARISPPYTKSPPIRPVPVSRPNSWPQPPQRRSSSVAQQTPSQQHTPPDSPTPPNSPPSSSMHNRFHAPSSLYRSDSSRSSSPHGDDDDRDNSYSPKSKPGVSCGTICVFASVVFALMAVLSLVANNYSRWITPTFSSPSTSSSLASYPRPLLPALSIHNPFIPPSQSSPLPVLNVTALLSHNALIPKRLPQYTWADPSHSRPPPSSDPVPAAHPWYTPPPVQTELVVPRKYERVALHYVTNVTPKGLRKVALPGNDPGMGWVADGEGLEQQGADDDSGGLVGGVKVRAGVKIRPQTDDDAIEWTEEEREANRRTFANLTLNKNLMSRITWKPQPHTLTLHKDFPPPVTSSEQYLFGDDYRFVLLTDKAQHGLARKIIGTWGQYVKHWTVYSDWYDSKLNTTVLKNPQPTWTARDYKYSSWRVSAFIAHLARHSELHRPFYMVVDQFSFPLLDQVHWRIQEWKSVWKQQLPAFIAGRPDKRVFKYSYFPQQQDEAAALFTEPLQIVPQYMYGFDHTSLLTLSYYTPLDVCPVLQEDPVALAGLIFCAGGIQQEYHFLAMTRSNHREKDIHASSSLAHWRGLDVYSATRTIGMLEEAFQWYYGKLGQTT